MGHVTLGKKDYCTGEDQQEGRQIYSVTRNLFVVRDDYLYLFLGILTRTHVSFVDLQNTLRYHVFFFVFFIIVG
jgi:hypothetical protein